MDSIGSALFLACFTLIPLAMVALIAYRVVAWARERRRLASLSAAGWEPIDAADPALRDALGDLRLDHARARFFDVARLGEGEGAIIALTRQIPRGGGSDPSLGGGSTLRCAIARRTASGPVGVVSKRQGGVMEAMVLGVAGAIGEEPIEPPGWSWAIVGSPDRADAWSANAGAATEPLIGPGERVHIGRHHIAIVTSGPLTALMGDARERLEALEAALAR